MKNVADVVVTGLTILVFGPIVIIGIGVLMTVFHALFWLIPAIAILALFGSESRA